MLILPLILLLCLACTGVGTAATLVLPLGDSITHGSDSYPSYRAWLYQDLGALGYDVDFVGSSHTPALPDGLDPDNEGHSNYTAGQVLAGLPGWLEAYPLPDVALVHLGTNDAIYSVPSDRTIADLREIVGVLRARNPSTTILIAQIIPTSVASINARIEALNREISGLQSLSTAQSPIVIVDQYSGYNGQADNQGGGVHPLTSGEKKMAARWEDALVPVLDRVAPPGITQYGPHAVPGRIEAEDYDLGGYVDTTPGNAGSAYRHDDVDIEYAASEESYAVGWVRDGESLTYTANVTTGGPFTLNARVASPNDGRTIALEVNGTPSAVIPVPNTSSFDTFATATVEVVLPAGPQNLTLRFSGDGQNLNWFEFVPVVPGPTTTVPPLPPQDITDLRNTTYEARSITWTWTDPADAGFAKVTVCLDGVPAGTVERGVQRFTATGLVPATAHTIGTRTLNAAGVASATWTNQTARTAPDATPPASVTDLGNTTFEPTSITWTWTDPADAAFANVTVCLDGAPVGVVAKGVRSFTATGLTPDTLHTISTQTADGDGHANATWVNHTARTAPDITPPAPVTGLVNATCGPTYITWTWIDPADADFANVTVYLDDVVAGVVEKSVRSYNATGLAPSPAHTIATRTADASGNVNTAWVNHTTTTVPAPGLLLSIPGGAGAPTDTNADGLHDDVNGNGRKDFADVVLYFNQMSWISANEPVEGFDFNANGRIDFADAVALFNAL